MAPREAQKAHPLRRARRLAGRAALLGALAAGLLAAPAALGQQQQQQQQLAPAAPLAPPPAQAAPAAPGVTTGERLDRVTFVTLDQMAYVEHPFFQITGDDTYKKGDAATSQVVDGTPTTAEDEPFLTKLIHSLPDFGYEAAQNTTLTFPRAYAVGFDFTHFGQSDRQAVDSNDGMVNAPGITMDSYYYNAYIKGLVFSADEPGINYFVGVGLGLLEGRFLAKPLSGAKEESVAFSQSPVGFSQLGVELLGESFGFRYELRVMNAEKVKLEQNPYLDSAGNPIDKTTIDFSGSMVRLSVFYQF